MRKNVAATFEQYKFVKYILKFFLFIYVAKKPKETVIPYFYQLSKTSSKQILFLGGCKPDCLQSYQLIHGHGRFYSHVVYPFQIFSSAPFIHGRTVKLCCSVSRWFIENMDYFKRCSRRLHSVSKDRRRI